MSSSSPPPHPCMSVLQHYRTTYPRSKKLDKDRLAIRHGIVIIRRQAGHIKGTCRGHGKQKGSGRKLHGDTLVVVVVVVVVVVSKRGLCAGTATTFGSLASTRQIKNVVGERRVPDPANGVCASWIRD